MITKSVFAAVGLASLSLVACGAEGGAGEAATEGAPGAVEQAETTTGKPRPVYVGFIDKLNPHAATVEVKTLPVTTTAISLLKYQCKDGSTVEVAGFCQDANWADAIWWCKNTPPDHPPSEPTGFVTCTMKQ